MAKLSDSEVSQMHEDFGKFVTRVEPYLSKVDQHETSIRLLQDAQLTEEQRTSKTVRAILRTGEFRRRDIVNIVAGLVVLAGTIYGIMK